MRYPLRKLAYYYRTEGARALVRKVFEVVRQTCWSETRWLVYERKLEGKLAHGPKRLLRHKMDLQALIASSHPKASAFPEATTRRFDLGQTCHGFYLGDRLATVGWSSVDYLELDEDVTVPCPGGVGLFDFVTFDEFRSRGCYTEALLQLIAEMQGKGFARVLIAVDPGNVASIRGIVRAGFVPAARVTRRRRFGAHSVIRRALD